MGLNHQIEEMLLTNISQQRKMSYGIFLPPGPKAHSPVSGFHTGYSLFLRHLLLHFYLSTSGLTQTSPPARICSDPLRWVSCSTFKDPPPPTLSMLPLIIAKFYYGLCTYLSIPLNDEQLEGRADLGT